jgi:hypothetical protein
MSEATAPATMKPKFSGNFKEVKESLEGKFFGGENGRPLTLIDIKLGEGKNEAPRLDFVFAPCSWDLKFGSTGAEAMEPTEMVVGWTIQGMQEYTVRSLNDGLGLIGDEKLQDDDEDWMRLVAADHPKSLVKLIGKETKGMYVTATVQEKNETEIKGIYFNFFARPPKDSVAEKKFTVADLKKRFNR